MNQLTKAHKKYCRRSKNAVLDKAGIHDGVHTFVAKKSERDWNRTCLVALSMPWK